ncbi:hypothetical protein [Bacillus sp. Marseille-Q3570]|nr:hypothetical protein [Bacillus sp. Marseille-Q3570]
MYADETKGKRAVQKMDQPFSMAIYRAAQSAQRVEFAKFSLHLMA